MIERVKKLPCGLTLAPGVSFVAGVKKLLGIPVVGRTEKLEKGGNNISLAKKNGTNKTATYFFRGSETPSIKLTHHASLVHASSPAGGAVRHPMPALLTLVALVGGARHSAVSRLALVTHPVLLGVHLGGVGHHGRKFIFLGLIGVRVVKGHSPGPGADAGG